MAVRLADELPLSGNVNIAGGRGGNCGAMAVSRIVGGAGGNSQLGQGGAQVMQVNATDVAGLAGSGYGAGGGGATNDNAAGAGTVGGAGTAGIVIVTEFRQ